MPGTRKRREPGQRRLPSGKWQVNVQVRVPGEKTPKFLSKTFPGDSLLSDRRAWRERTRVEARSGQLTVPERSTFADDAKRYLAAVAALPTIEQRRQHIGEWVALFGARPRASIKPHEIRAQRDQWLTEPRTDQQGRKRQPLSAGSVNKRLRALSNLWRVLDGRLSPNPVREIPEADEIEGEPRALPYSIIKEILAAMPDVTRAPPGVPRAAGSQTKARLAVMAWTGLAHVQIAGLRPQDIDWETPSIWVKGRRKGPTGVERKGHRKPITAQAVEALRQFDALDCWGPFSRASMRKSLRTACRKIEAHLQEQGVPIDLSQVRPYDFRHSYATALLEATGDLKATQQLMLHASASTTERYARAAVNPMLVAALKRFTAHVDRDPDRDR